MSRRHNIKWQKSDSQELSKAVKNFNAKITRLEKKNPELKNALPEKASVKHLKEIISTRQDLKRELNALNRFTDRKNKISVSENGEYEGIEIYGDYNIKITKWQKTEINRRLPTINKRRKERLEFIEKLEVLAGGEGQGYTKEELGMGRLERIDLEPLNGLTPGMGIRDLKEKWKNVLKESQSGFMRKKDYQCRENYIKGLQEQYSRNDGKDIEDMVEKIEKMDIDDFLFTFYSDQNADFDEIYYPNDEEYQGYLSRLRTVWKV